MSIPGTRSLQCALLAAVLALLGIDAACAAQPDGLIARKVIFGNFTRGDPLLSPDGRRVAFLAPRDGVLNVFVAPRGDLTAAKPVTHDRKRGIREFNWAENSADILYLQDEGGDENWRLHVVDLATAHDSAVTPTGKVQARIVATSITKPNEILIGINDRDPQHHDVYRLDLRTGKQQLLLRNDEGYTGYVFDEDLTPRLAIKQTPAGGLDAFTVERSGSVKPFYQLSPEDAMTSSVLGYDVRGTTLYAYDSRGRDKAALVTLDPATGAPTVVAQSSEADVTGVLQHPVTHKVQAVQVDYLHLTWQAVDPAVAPDIEFLNAHAHGDWQVLSRSRDDRFWTIRVDRDAEPVSFWLYERQPRRFTRLYASRPALEKASLARMYPVEIKARDGLTLISYLTLPRSADTKANGKPNEPLPMVLYVHGGPWFRDRFGYNPTHLWLADRGYAVLSVNYRGSTGFGKRFLNLADGQFAGTMHDDLMDAVRWAVDNGIARKDKVAIMGGSYGGYATLVGMTFTPEAFACGVDIVGPSNLVTLIESFPAYWQPSMEVTWYKRVGDPRTAQGKEFLLSRSPITRVDRIAKPLLIGQGANDPRVTRKESDQIVAAMNERHIPVTYAIYADEGHGFARPENRVSFYAIAENFLSGCLGGRAQPIGEDFKGAALSVPDGAGNVPGLTEALATMAK
jgi:dipeptidyl aminopeptidase/acylaminoacyl peptidase